MKPESVASGEWRPDTVAGASGIIKGFDQKLSFFLVASITPLLFLPKINLIRVGGESAGLRVDEVFLMLAFLLIMCLMLHSKRPLLPFERLMGAFFAVSFVSFFINQGILIDHPEVHLSILYALRNIEYFVFFYVGMIAARLYNVSRMIWLLFVVNIIVVLMQRLSLIGGFTSNGYINSLSGAPVGLTAGHWELGFVLSLIYTLMLFSPRGDLGLCKYSITLSWGKRIFGFNPAYLGFFLFFSWIFLIIGARSALLTITLVSLIKILPTKRFWTFIVWLPIVSLFGLGTWVVLGYFDILSSSTLGTRSTNLFSLRNLEAFSGLVTSINVENMSFQDSFSDLNLNMAEGIGVDASWYIRIHKWAYVIKCFLSTPTAYLVGLGPGFCSTALDGGALRLIIEFGFIGAGIFWLAFKHVANDIPELRVCILAFIINMLFLDTYLAYKAMSLFLFVIGAHYSWHLTAIKSLKESP